jgi:hypothetical protein
MSDLVERLRLLHIGIIGTKTGKLCNEAADEIERLTADMKELRDEIIPHWSKREAIIFIDEALEDKS